MPGYSITVSAADAASNVLDGINGRLAALNKRAAAGFAPFTRLGDSVAKFAQVSGIDKIAGGIAEVGKQGRHAAVSLFRVLEPLGIIGGAASLAGIYKLTTAWGDFGAQLDISARRAGMSAASLYRLQGAAQLVNVSGETLASGMESLNDNLRNASFGGGAQFLATLRSIGVDFEALKRAAPEKRIELLTAALSKVRNVTDRKLFTGILFGSDAILPLMELTGKGLREVLAEADNLRGVYSEADVKNANAFNLAQTRLRLSIGGVGSQIATVLAPVLTPLLNDLTDAAVYTRRWMEANQAWLRGEISREIGRFATWLRGIDWPGIWQAMQRIARRANAVAESLGGWERVGEGVLAFMAGRFLINMLAPFGKLAWAIGKIGLFTLPLMVDAFKGSVGAVGTAVEGLINLFKLGLPAAIGIAELAVKAFNAATLKNPLMRAMAGVMTLLDSMTSDSGDLKPDDPRLKLLQGPTEGGGGLLGWLKSLIGISYGGGGGGGGGSGAGAGGAGGPGDGGGAKPPITPGARLGNAQSFGAVLKREGRFSRAGVAAFMGASDVESTWDRMARNGSHLGHMQWDKDRRLKLEAHFHKAFRDFSSADQARAVIYELDHNPEWAGLARKARGSDDLADISKDVTESYLKPGNYGVETPRRLRRSQPYLNFEPEGEPLAAPTGAAGPPGASGRVQMNVNVTGQPAQVSARASGGIDLNIAQPGLIGAM